MRGRQPQSTVCAGLDGILDLLAGEPGQRLAEGVNGFFGLFEGDIGGGSHGIFQSLSEWIGKWYQLALSGVRCFVKARIIPCFTGRNARPSRPGLEFSGYESGS